MSKQLNGSVAAFRPESACISIKCNTRNEFIFAWSNLAHIHDGKTEEIAQRGADELMWRTVLYHEMRHWNDFLLSFWGFEILRRKLQLSLNACALLQTTDWSKSSVFIIPMASWHAAAEGDRAAYTQWISENLKIPPERFYDIGKFSEAELNSTAPHLEETLPIRICLRDAKIIDDLHVGFSKASPISVQDVFELGATARQLLAAFDLAGRGWALHCLDAPLRHGYYGKLLNLGANFLHGFQPEEICRFQGLMATNCLVTLPPSESGVISNLHPGYRLTYLCDCLSRIERRQLARMIDNPMKALECFDQILGDPPLTARLRITNEYFRRKITGMFPAKSERLFPLPKAVLDLMLGFVGVLLNARVRLANEVSNSLEAFCYGTYEAQNAMSCILPPIVFDFRSMPEEDRNFLSAEYVGMPFDAGEICIFLSDEMRDVQAGYNNYSILESAMSHLMFGSASSFGGDPELGDLIKRWLPNQRVVRYDA